MRSWYDQSAQSIDDDLENGLITAKEYSQQMRELNQEYDQEAREASDKAYDDFY